VDEVATPTFTSIGSGVKKAIIPKMEKHSAPKSDGSKLPELGDGFFFNAKNCRRYHNFPSATLREEHLIKI